MPQASKSIFGRKAKRDSGPDGQKSRTAGLNDVLRSGSTVGTRVLALAFLLMLGASLVTVFQPLRSDPQQGTKWQGFWYPLETNSYQRLPVVVCANDYACRFNDIAESNVESIEEAWAVGNVGLVMHRAPGSTVWQQLRIVVTLGGKSVPQPFVGAGTPTTGGTSSQSYTATDDFLGISCTTAPIRTPCTIIGRSGILYESMDSAKTWSARVFAQANGSPESAYGAFAGRRNGDRTKPLEITATGQAIYENADFSIVSTNTSAQHYSWKVGSSGLVELADKNGVHQFNTGTRATLRAIAPSPIYKKVLVAGDNGTILSSDDEGKTWKHETQGPEGTTPNYRLPAPWYWVAAIFAIALCFVATTVSRPDSSPEVSVADWIVADTPLKPGDHELLGFGRLVRGLSRFIRNPKTQPPITIAVEGKWGEGKSSVMSLLCGELKKARFRPVWFNAWHHQSEEQLLGSLLENIRKQALPPYWHFENLFFRVRLLVIRFGQMWPLVLFVTVIFLGSTAYEYKRHANDSRATDSRTLNEAADKNSAKKTSRSAGSGEANSDDGLDLGKYTQIGSFLGLLVAGIKKIKAFGVEPAKLAGSFKEGTAIRELKPDPGIRRKFAREFKDICEAWSWGGRRVIIFIDDLDRCRPDNVVTVLESVNFLTSAGECIVVMGIAPETVTHCVGLSFKDIAETEANFRGLPMSSDQDKVNARYSYGALYMKKLINIRSSLPTTTEEQRSRILDFRLNLLGTSSDQPKAGTRRERLWNRLVRAADIARKMLPISAILLLISVSVWSGMRVGTTQVSSTPDQGTEVNPVPFQPLDRFGVTEGDPDKLFKYSQPTKESAKLQPGAGATIRVWWSYGIYGILPLVGIILFAGLLSIRSNQDAVNSPEFEESLRIWTPCILSKCETPRELKRVLNDLRYQAMMRRDDADRGSWLERLVKGSQREAVSNARIKEADLPPYKVMELHGLSGEDRTRFLNTEISQRSYVDKRLMKAKEEHIKLFHRWIDDSDDQFSQARGASAM